MSKKFDTPLIPVDLQPYVSNVEVALLDSPDLHFGEKIKLLHAVSNEPDILFESGYDFKHRLDAPDPIIVLQTNQLISNPRHLAVIINEGKKFRIQLISQFSGDEKTLKSQDYPWRLMSFIGIDKDDYPTTYQSKIKVEVCREGITSKISINKATNFQTTQEFLIEPSAVKCGQIQFFCCRDTKCGNVSYQKNSILTILFHSTFKQYREIPYPLFLQVNSQLDFNCVPILKGQWMQIRSNSDGNEVSFAGTSPFKKLSKASFKSLDSVPYRTFDYLECIKTPISDCKVVVRRKSGKDESIVLIPRLTVSSNKTYAIVYLHPGQIKIRLLCRNIDGFVFHTNDPNFTLNCPTYCVQSDFTKDLIVDSLVKKGKGKLITFVSEKPTTPVMELSYKDGVWMLQ